MSTFNKILNPMYSAIATYSTQEDGSINAKYVLGTGTDNEGSVTDFTPIISEYKWIDAVAAKSIIDAPFVKDDIKWIDAVAAKSIIDAPFVKDDIGKTPTQIMLSRIYAYLKESGQIVV